ncbi:hypothetical protein SPRG_01721 [Saprolegnia parasitica CBS 223.65]|uniref:J domain-containing protein n=1 Tax=Saprolegnia parasitica (strain CBS 223.65) TaxID=695850 RepID=A0A067D496_SAPPC|nr:hypothetical protein SPRG_01721 [Saprolegnia parasitica CBS 223.65]KDO33842.1 hypothetical protein SPRG_01721 [Saprolegnia parasitica CBS 223.65]|eukprot:XP_012195478.1 hypothetical protein SPRG_01721 [Saprolegnia parasitica CBS 223.65]
MTAPSKVKHTRYYELMGVAVNASADELKKAYRRKALQLHPDKRGNTPEAQDEFTAMKAAYDVLSDPKQREIYDTMGEDGLRVMNDFGEMRFDDVVTAAVGAVAAMSACAKMMIFMAVLLGLGLALLVPILWCLRADNDVDWSWINVFAPMWLLDAIYLCWTGCSMAAGDATDDVDTSDRPSRTTRCLAKCAVVLHILLFVLTQIFVAMKLQGSVTWSCGVVLAPLFVLEGFYLSEKLLVAYRVYDAFRAKPDAPVHFLMREIARSCLVSVLSLSFEILLALRIDGVITVSWWLVFLPVWLLLALLAAPLLRAMTMRPPAGDGEAPAPSYGMHACLLLGLLALVSPFVLLAARLETSIQTSLYVLLPWFLVAGAVLLTICTCLCCLRPIEAAKDDDDAPSVESPRHNTDASPHPYYHDDNMA